DPDCADASVDACDRCDGHGACGGGDCPGSVNADNNALCDPPPNWSCLPEFFGNGVCDCGCTAVDVDCADETSASCANCPNSRCSPLGCGNVDPEHNAICAKTPIRWTCSPELYHDGKTCDCGCGYFDPDCAANDVDVCDSCDSVGACSQLACPGRIDLENI